METKYDELHAQTSKYMSSEDVEKVHKAYHFAKIAHEGQIRKSGEPFISHPVSVALVLAKINMPYKIIIAALLHDVVEDTDYEYDDIAKNFSVEIADIVDGVTKLGNISGLSNDFVRAENHRKIILATARDARVILVKLADRVHNMQTIKHMNSAKQKLIANETLEVYTPIAHRLGMYQIKWELEDLSFKCINPDAYDKIAQQLNMKRSEREEVVLEIVDEMRDYLNSKNMEVEIKGRSKHIYSIYQKLTKQNKDFEELTDLFAFRVIVKTIPECYSVLGIIHEKYKPIPMKFKDYIPTPKHNMYQSIHTTVISELGFPIEFQIRTQEMDVTAEFGIASHWMYKEDVDSSQLQNEIQERIAWLKQATMLDADIDPRKFMDQVKLDFLSKNLIVYTPKGDVIDIPEGSRALDFAYYIHSSVGNTAVSAKVNEHVVSLFYKLKIGDIVQIITNDNAQPSLSYTHKVKTTKAKEALRKYFRDAEKRQICVEGRKIIIKQAQMSDIFDIKTILSDENIVLLNSFNVEDIEEIYYNIATGALEVSDLIEFIKNEKREIITTKNDVIINNDENISHYRFCRYCSPVYGDEIYAHKFLDKNNLNHYFVHRNGCSAPHEFEAKFTPLSKSKMYVARIQLEILDQTRSISKVLESISKLNINITSIYFRASMGRVAFGRISLEISHLVELTKLCKDLNKHENVISVSRILEEDETTKMF